MGIKKELIVAVLATFCLTAALFMIVPTRSQTGSYNARMDVNGDGSIDMADLQAGIDNFMTYGDPTLPVIITGHASATLLHVHNYDMGMGGEFFTTRILVYGYAKFSINFAANLTNIEIAVRCGYYDGSVFHYTLQDDISRTDTYYFAKTYDVMNECIMLHINNWNAAPVRINELMIYAIA